ncbi:amino acid deaminase [Actinobacteria bacterium YIM 96077]|uniref:Amino acid deaminase n=1 Tax=Phytoactinopolyspora halophila TaxID=1981511 RepID=A0A329QR16_9ACTN|nr:alanine racemase [Phytoactinopolyspora halophila]AYY14501.1 amino acid deaminase [Actinobacteria bacterium YIM 96077]RAW14119.1 amino acid deaminase [Phytoactinopolyspora halophila]
MGLIGDDWTIDWRCKSFPPMATGMPSSRIAAAGWQLHRDFGTPVAVLKEDALAHNLDRMRRYCAENGVVLAPHGKTTMSPELIGRQLHHGAWAMTAATAWQARAMFEFGASRVIVANECLDPVGLRWLAEYLRENPGAEAYAFVDSLDAVEMMRSLVPGDMPFPVLVEMGIPGGRAGARDVDTAIETGTAVAAAPELDLAGVAGFEGILGSERVPSVVESVREFLERIRHAAEELIHADAFRAGHPVLLSAGGSAFFDQVVDVFTANQERYARPVQVVIRAGCYLTHDHGVYQNVSPFAGEEHDFRAAMEVWARVISTPEPGLALIDAGKRDISTDSRMPAVLCRVRGDAGAATPLPAAAVEGFNDQHGYVRFARPAGESSDDEPVLRVGDLVALGISHPCTTFDKWRAIPVVNDEYRVISAVRTFF